MYRISFLDGQLKGREITVSEPRLVIGSASECGLRLLTDGIAPQHAELVDEGGRVCVRRLDATAVLAIGSAPVGDELRPLKPGDVLSLGSLRLRFHSASVARLPSASRRVSPMATFAAIAVAIMFAVEIAWLFRAASRSSQTAVAAALAEAHQQRSRTPPAVMTPTGGPSDRAENPGP